MLGIVKQWQGGWCGKGNREGVIIQDEVREKAGAEITMRRKPGFYFESDGML